MKDGGLDPTPGPSQDPPEKSRPEQTLPPEQTTSTLHYTSEEHERIGNYHILEPIGSGGMGEVYRAEQIHPMRRTVALKIIKRGMDTREVIARFEAERQALALMEHPNIAKIFDAGSTPSGRPYFAMEYVPGVPITRFCDKQRLTTEERLGLFVQLCTGVQHAHQKAIIHRDLKPSNILVTTEGNAAVPKIIDFGVAKATAQKLTEKTLFTAFGELIGTPEYMSPEQAELSGVDVDTRTDVYSLGVILYELLSGALPFEPQELRRAGFEGITRMIREQDPPRPSTKVSTLGARRDEVAQARRTLPDRLRRALCGDLDWITMRALEKNPARRYGSASELAADVQRHLRHEPVLASPPSVAYRTGKFVRRHRVGVSFVVAVVMLLTGFSVTMGVLWNAAEDAREEAQARAAELEVVTKFQSSMLAEIDVEEMGRALYADFGERVRSSLEDEGRSAAELETMLEEFLGSLRRANATDVALELVDTQVLSRAVEAIEADFADKPVVGAALLQTVADTYRELGQYPQAVPLQRRALDIRRRALGDDHPKTLLSVNTMAILLINQGKLEEALRYCREALDGNRHILGDDHPQTLTSLNTMGALLSKMGKYDEALRYCREGLERKRRVFGEDDPQTLASLNTMGAVLQSMGRFEEALSCFRGVLTGRRRVLGEDHKWTLSAMNNLGVLLYSMGKYDEALVYWREALNGRRRVLGDDHPRTLASIGSMGVLLKAMGKYDEAFPYCREALEGDRRVLGNDHPWTLMAIGNMGTLLKAMGKYDEAFPYCREALEGDRRVLGEDHPSTLKSITTMADLFFHQGKPEEALALVEPAEKATRQAFTGGNAAWLGVLLALLGRSQTAMGKLDLARKHLNEAYEILRDAPNATAEDRAMSLIGLAEFYEAWHADDPNRGHDLEAARWRALLAEQQAATKTTADEN